jgi:hypothetical protein
MNTVARAVPSHNTVHGTARWVVRPIAPCTLIPGGVPGVLAIDNGKGLCRSYVVAELLDDKAAPPAGA